MKYVYASSTTSVICLCSHHFWRLSVETFPNAKVTLVVGSWCRELAEILQRGGLIDRFVSYTVFSLDKSKRNVLVRLAKSCARIGLCLATAQEASLRSVRRYAALLPLRLAACRSFRSKSASRFRFARHVGCLPSSFFPTRRASD